MLSLKPGVKLKDLQPQIALAITVAFAAYGGRMTVTSCNDSAHKVGSLHYSGLAVDIRLNDLSGVPAASRASLARIVRDALGPEFDVLHEYVGTPNEHLHIEYDPTKENR